MRFIFSLVVFLFLACNMSARAQNVSSPRQAKQESLYSYLARQAVLLDCYFTFELNATAEQGTKFHAVERVFPDVKTTAELVATLNRSMPDADVFPDSVNSQIIHLKERKFVSLLDQVTSITYSGRVLGMVDELGKTSNVPLHRSRAYSVPGGFFDDWVTKISFSSSKKPVRSILSNFLPLSNYRRFLWIAGPAPHEGKEEIQIQYYGPNTLNRPASMTAVFPTPRTLDNSFELGELAFALNKSTDVEYSSALSFIAAQMEEKAPRQVRWAMFYLGKYKVDRAIPTLLRFIDYQYAPSPLIEERFPALRALREIGTPAADAALSAVPTETDPQRLELLLRTVIGVKGADKGGARIDAAMKVAPKAQAERIRTARTEAAKSGATATVPEPPAAPALAATTQLPAKTAN